MNRILPAVIAVLVAGVASAAEPVPATGTSPAPATIDRSAGPAVITSPAAAPAPATAAPAADPATPLDAAPAARPGRAATPAVPGSRPAAAAGRAQDRLDLEATQITGNRELPRVMYVVPWKRSDVGAGPGRPANSLLDEVLAPVDRDVFLRQGRYYEALRPDAPAAP